MKDEDTKNLYIPYGKEWEKEMMKFTKKEIIGELRLACMSYTNLKDKLEKSGINIYY